MEARDYMDLPYNCIVKPIEDESGSYFRASVLELDGCQSTGATYEEASTGLREAMMGWIETKLENGFSVPLPSSQPV
jgi:predicted RNase H-like HicB family nuclease